MGSKHIGVTHIEPKLLELPKYSELSHIYTKPSFVSDLKHMYQILGPYHVFPFSIALPSNCGPNTTLCGQ